MYKLFCENCCKHPVRYATSEFVREAVSEFTGCDTSKIQLEYGANGRPLVLFPPDTYLSVSHTGTYAVTAVSDTPVGVDVEVIRRYNPLILKKFTEEERIYIQSGGEERFFEVWCAKEAILKLSGIGLSGGLSSFSVCADDKLLNRIGSIQLNVNIADGICLAVAVEK